jgi:hypothetical protein
MSPNDISDLRGTIVPKSDQLNSEQLLAGPMTITVADVRIGSSDEQPVTIHYVDDNGRPFKPCKTMRKVLIFAWGEDGRAWVGRMMTLYNDEAVRFGGMQVGGIRISHLSDIEREVQLSLTATKGKKSMHTIQKLERVSLGKVIDAIQAATNKAGMEVAKKLAEQLTIAGDIEAARHAYGERVQQLKKGPATAPATTAKTYAQFVDEVHGATGPEAAGLVLDEARKVLDVDLYGDLVAAFETKWG